MTMASPSNRRLRMYLPLLVVGLSPRPFLSWDISGSQSNSRSGVDTPSPATMGFVAMRHQDLEIVARSAGQAARPAAVRSAQKTAPAGGSPSFRPERR